MHPNHAHRSDTKRRFFAQRCWKFALLIPLVIAVKSGLVFFLWNELVPVLFHGPALTYLQAVELMVLLRILLGFGGGKKFPHRRFGRAPWRDLPHHDREAIIKGFRDHCDKHD